MAKIQEEPKARRRTERQMRRLRHALTELLEGRPLEQAPTRRHVRGGMRPERTVVRQFN